MDTDNRKGGFTCHICDKVFKHKQSLNRHVRLVHNQPACADIDTDNGNEGFPCHMCDNVFKHKKSLNRHVRLVHNQAACAGSRVLCPEAACRASFNNRDQLRQHIESNHNITLEVEEETFQSYDDFKMWKSGIEKQEKCNYIAKQSLKKLISGKKKKYFLCHRSGIYSSNSRGKRRCKYIGSKKINGCCPSSMEVLIGNEVHVKFWKTHFGHGCEIEHLKLSEKEKAEISEKLKNGVTFERILDDVRNYITGCGLERIHLIKRQDLRNIAYANNRLQNKGLHEHDATSVGLWVKKENQIDVTDEVNEILNLRADVIPSSSLKNNILSEKWRVVQDIINHQLASFEEMGEQDLKVIGRTFDNVIGHFGVGKAKSFAAINASEPSNKKISPQLLFLSTKKRRLSKKVTIREPTEGEKKRPV